MNDEIEMQEEKTPEEVLAEMKETMVPREELERVTKKYNNLFQAVANGVMVGDNKPAEKSEKEKYEEYVSFVKDLAEHKVRKPVEHVKRLLAIDDYRRDHGERSLFEPSIGERTDDVVASADRTRDVLKNCLEKSECADAVFMAMVQNSLKETVN